MKRDTLLRALFLRLQPKRFYLPTPFGGSIAEPRDVDVSRQTGSSRLGRWIEADFATTWLAAACTIPAWSLPIRNTTSHRKIIHTDMDAFYPSVEHHPCSLQSMGIASPNLTCVPAT
jgi:hypothetical protein